MPFYVSMGRASLTSMGNNISPYQYSSPDGNSVWKGPRKICCFCSLAIVFPALLISVPLLMRFVMYGSSEHFLNPSDMKILDQRISTTWCQGETVRMNTTFTAYLTDGEPSVIETPTLLTIDRNLIIPDDHKEYWGFYLLKGSRFKIRTCARWKGGTLLVVQGRNHLEHCAYIGEADSAGDSDQVSGSNSIELINNEMMTTKRKTHSQEEMSTLLSRIRQYIKTNPRNYGKLKKNLANWLLIEQEAAKPGAHDLSENDIDFDHNNGSSSHFRSKTGDEVDDNSTSLADIDEILDEVRGRLKNASSTKLGAPLETGIIRRSRRQAEVRPNTDSGENGAFEDDTHTGNDASDEIPSLAGVVHPRMKFLANRTSASHSHTPDSIWTKEHGHHVGVLNQTFDPNDGSNSESESSFSSSEEALLKCEGVVASFNLHADDNCGAEGSYEDLDMDPGRQALFVQSSVGPLYSLPFYEDVVNSSGYYYFIFGSENEKRDNFIRAKFELEKLEYQLPEPVKNCTDVKECRVHFSFASSQKVIVRIPQHPPHTGDTWDQVYIAETECQPRTHLYMIFALLVPLVILLCAFQ